MSKPLKPRRGTTAEHASFIGQAHEVTYDTDKHTLVMHDGVTPGGFPLAKEGDVSALDTALRALIAAQDEAIAAAQSSADAAQSSADAAQNSVPVGTVIAFAANSEPQGGYLLCNGAAVSRTTYAPLFGVVGVTYGVGDDSTTFNLPNLTDRFIQGSGTAGTVKNAGAPEISGSFNIRKMGSTGSMTTIFTATGAVRIDNLTDDAIALGVGGSSSPSAVQRAKIAASLSNSIYGKSNTIQPPALTMRYYIKY